MPVYAQVSADSTAISPADSTTVNTTVLPDSTHIPVDTTATPPTQPPIGLTPPEPGTQHDSTAFAQTRFAELADLLATRSGTWTYTLGTPAWADGWSPYGAPPHAPGLTLDGLPFNDLLDGHPRFDLLPLELLEPVRDEPAHLGHPTTIHTTTQAYQNLPPFTELRYHKGQHGMQYVSGLHVQERKRHLLGREGRLQVLFRYGGRGTTNEYPNSEAHIRQVYGRLRFESPRWLITLGNHYAQWQGGAHGGVQPRAGADFTSVYTRFGARVRLPTADRVLKRNHLVLSLRFRGLLEDAPLSSSLYWTTQVSRYKDADTLSTQARRLGLQLRQPLNLIAGHEILLRLDAWTDRIQETTVWTETPKARNQWHLSLHDGFQAGPLNLSAEVGWHGIGTTSFGSVELRAAGGPVHRHLFAETYHTGRTPAWLESTGYGTTVQPVDTPLETSRMTFGRLGLTLKSGAWDATLFGFGHRTTYPVDLYATALTDSVRFIQSSDPLSWTGAGADLGWRRQTQRGVYATAQPSLFAVSNTAGIAQERVQESLPRWTVQGRLGARFRLFDELDLDAYLTGRFWAANRSRLYHPQTGLFVIPQTTDLAYGPSGSMDVHLEAGLRGARLFLSWENALAGLTYAGTLVVPVYPLPERLVRFGVYWPILN